MKWMGTTHREIVNRSIDGERSDISTWKDQWINNIRIGCHCQPGPGDLKNGPIVTLFKQLIPECGEDQLLEQLAGQASPATVAK
jgi:hypothetical protein